jgi:hypothetical protein
MDELEDGGISREELTEQLETAAADSGFLEGANVPALFSAFLEKTEINFKIGTCKKDSSVTLQPMNADKLARYRDSVSRFSTVEGKGSSRFYFEPSTADSDVALLAGTVVSMELFYDKPVIGGGTTVEEYPFPKAGDARVKFFKELHPVIRGRLVEECKKVNGLHPLSQG